MADFLFLYAPNTAQPVPTVATAALKAVTPRPAMTKDTGSISIMILCSLGGEEVVAKKAMRKGQKGDVEMKK